MNVEAVAERVRAEFEEMPGMTLTVSQASRLFGVDQQICRAVVERLIDADYLRWARAGVITRGDR